MDTALKQRLIGAAVLTGLAVVFLPMLFESSTLSEREVTDIPMAVPPAPKDGFETRELPLTGPGAVPEGGVMGMGEAPPAPVKMDAQVQDALPAPPPSPATAAGDYAVNFGSYASRADADRIVAALAGLQLNAVTEPVKLADKQAWRVYIGPFASRADAEQARIRALTLGNNARATVVTRDAESAPAVDSQPVAAAAPVQVAQQATPVPVAAAERPVVTENKPAQYPQTARPAATENKPAAQARAEAAPKPAAAPVPAPPKPAASSTGFAVQLGAFANAADAQALRERARAAGFSAITETVRTDRGTLTRVRLGPVADRAAAERIQAQARSKLGVDGMVRAHP
ncbi:sporulation protein [Lysobacteraceae bacterium NML95-0200]|nr:sporulation protein [Xanthomonadaceae bacterium NML95-0200]